MAAAKLIRAMTPDRLKIFSGTANPCLAREICAALGLELGNLMLETFSDGEMYLQSRKTCAARICFRDPADLHARSIAT